MGLPSSGKSTLAGALAEVLDRQGIQCCLLDGDVLRSGLCKDLGFSDDDRHENIRRAAEVAKLVSSLGVLVIAAFITPLSSHQHLVREVLKDQSLDFVYLDCSIETCIERDVKGLYAAALEGRLHGMSGVDAPFDVPELPGIIHLSTSQLRIEECVQRLLKVLLN